MKSKKITDIEKEILNGESDALALLDVPTLEDINNKSISYKKQFENILLKNIAGFLNSEKKGKIILGVNSINLKIVGIENSYLSTYKNQSTEGSENKIMRRISMLIEINFKEHFLSIKQNMVNVRNKTLYIINCSPSSEPCFLNDKFYLRNGVINRELQGKQIISFQKARELNEIHDNYKDTESLGITTDKNQDNLKYKNITPIEKEILNGIESETIEFLSTSSFLNFNKKQGKESPYGRKLFEDILLKNIAGFLNSIKGGKVVIGINSKGDIEGINSDFISVFYKYAKNSSLDKIMLYFSTLTNNNFKEHFPYIHISLIQIKEKPLIVFNCFPSSEPCFINDKFYFRYGVVCRELRGKEIITFQKTRKLNKTQNNNKDTKILNNIIDYKEKVKLKSEQIKKEFGELQTIMTKFDLFLNKKSLDVLNKEIKGFYDEYESGHYTSAALRVGRTFENIVYTLAREWNVNFNRETLKTLSTLENQFQQLSNYYIIYNDSEINEKKKIEKDLKRIGMLINERINKIIDNTEKYSKESEKTTASNPKTLNAIIRDIKKKYNSHTSIKSKLIELLKSNLIGELLKYRNAAAHANIKGEYKEITKTQVQAMMKNFMEIMNYFIDIADMVNNLDFS